MSRARMKEASVPMIGIGKFWLAFLPVLFESRSRLEAKNIALHH